VVEFDDYQRLTVADIPGLIEGAHRNVGLGHDFLRHIVRCKLLVFVLDTAGSEGRNPINDLQTLRRELDLYDPTLSRRPWLIAANKMDLPEAGENLKALEQRFPDRKIVPISAKENDGIEALKASFQEFLLQPETEVSEGSGSG
jgi:GTPase